MKKEKVIIAVTIGLMSFVLVCVMFMQFKVVNETDIAEIESMREDELQSALSEWKEKYEETQSKLEETQSKINDYKEKSESNEETSKLVEKELSEANIILGKTDVTGDGVQVTLTDNNEKAYEAKDLVNLINELRAAGAEAISINGQRLVTTSAIECDGNVIMVNGEKVAAPFEIKAIGLQEALISIDRIGGYLYNLREWRYLEPKIEKSDKITIPKYTGIMKFQYLESK